MSETSVVAPVETLCCSFAFLAAATTRVAQSVELRRHSISLRRSLTATAAALAVHSAPARLAPSRGYPSRLARSCVKQVRRC